MIRFKCIYCGQKITAKDGTCGKRGKCPKCSHTIMVPRSTKGKRILDPDITEESQKMMEACAMLDITTRQAMADEDVPLGFETPGWLVPTYDKLSLFLTAVTLIILGTINHAVLKDIFQLIKISLRINTIGAFTILLIPMFLAGMGLSLYYIFTNKEAMDNQKKAMVTFAAVANAVTSGLASYYLIKNGKASGILILFPIWNLINAVLLLLMLQFKIINRNCIIDRDISFFRVVFSLVFSIIILLLCECVFQMYWAITLSICMIYTTSFDRAIQNTLLAKFSPEEQHNII